MIPAEPAHVAKHDLLVRQSKPLTPDVVAPNTLRRLKLRPEDGSNDVFMGDE